MKIKITEIRSFLLCNPQYFSDNNSTKIENIKSQNKYYFICDRGHEFLSLPTNVFKDSKICCPVCSGRQVVRGINDLWTTHPELACRLLNKEDGHKYSFGSNRILKWKCP